MEILFNDWTISTVQHSQIKQFDDHYHEIRITGDIPAEYSWDLLVHAENYQGEFENIISLSTSEDSLSSTLSANDLAENGWYTVQLRGISTADSSICRHTNLVSFYVDKSLSGDLTWPALPTEFSQCEARIKSVASHPPIPDENGFWKIWNSETSTYQSTLYPVGLQGLQGQPGEKGDKGEKGEKGDTGAQGQTGATGATGPQGPIGPTGPQGVQGEKGETGEQGPTGPQGAAGPTGNGISSIAKISGTGAPGTTDTYRITYTNGNHFDFNVYNGADGQGAVLSVNGETGNVLVSNENLLDNPWFTVNQRGATTYTVGAYGVDRWKLISGSATVTENGIQLNGTLRQIREFSVGAATHASVKMYSGAATATYDDTTKYFDIVSSGGIVRAAKLEVGTVSTITQDVAPNYTDELRRCQRYFEKVVIRNFQNGISPSGYFHPFLTVYHTKKRAKPSLTWELSQSDNVQRYTVFQNAGETVITTGFVPIDNSNVEGYWYGNLLIDADL